MIIKLLLL